MSEPISKPELDRMKDPYTELIGFVPPRVDARLRVSGDIDPEYLRLQEAMRRHCMYPPCFDIKITQLMLFGMLLMTMGDGAKFHAIAARRAGATWEELHATAAMAGLFRGLPAMNLAAAMLDELRRSELPA